MKNNLKDSSNYIEENTDSVREITIDKNDKKSNLEKTESLEYTKKENMFRLIIRVTTVILILLIIIAMYLGTTSSYFESPDGFSKDLKALGIFAPVIFSIFAISQYIITTVPFGLTNTLGASLFGLMPGIILNIIAMVIGSSLSFLLARKVGPTLVRAFTTKDTYNKYVKRADNSDAFTKLLAIAFLFPLFPDTLLCMVAGLTKMDYKKFIKILLIFRTPAIIVHTIITTTGFEYIMNNMFS